MLIVSCNDNETKENVHSFGEDTWIEILAEEESKFKKIDVNKDSDLDYQHFIEMENKGFKEGTLTYNERKNILEKNYWEKSETEGYFFEDEKMDVLISRYNEWEDNPKEEFFYKLEWKTKDSVFGTLFSFKKSDIEQMKKGEEIKNLLLIRKPKYKSHEARDILIKKKVDLDLELITQKQYDSIKNKLSRYITD